MLKTFYVWFEHPNAKLQLTVQFYARGVLRKFCLKLDCGKTDKAGLISDTSHCYMTCFVYLTTKPDSPESCDHETIVSPC